MQRGRIGAVLVLLFLLTGLASASVTIHEPIDAFTYTQTKSVTVNASADAGYELTEYEIPTAGITNDDISSDQLYSEVVGDGEHTIIVYAENNTGHTVNETHGFTVDTTAPSIDLMRPHGTVLTTLSPTILVEYSDAVVGADDDTVTVWLDGPDPRFNDTALDENASNGEFTADLSDLAEGTYVARVAVNDSVDHRVVKEWNFTLPKKPVLSNQGPSGLLDGTDASIQITADDPSGIDVDAAEIEVDGPEDYTLDGSDLETDTSVGGRKAVFEYELDDLRDGEYDVKARITDNSSAAHVAQRQWSFIVDTTPPDLELRSHSSGDVVTDDQTFIVQATDDLSDVDEVRVTLDDESEAVHDSVDDTFVADLDTDDVADGEQELLVRAEDEAGNRRTIEKTLIVDNTAPTVRSISVYPEIVATQARITATVLDSATRIEEVTYEVPGEDVTGTLLAEDGAFDEDAEAVVGTLDGEQLTDGEYALWIVAEDGAGHVTRERYTFDVDHSRSANLTITVAAPVLATRGDQHTVDLNVKNIGDADDLVSLSTTSNLDTSITPEEKRIQVGETRSFELELDVSGNVDLGPQTVDVTAQGFSVETGQTVTVHVQPEPAEQQAIEHRLQELEDTFMSLQERKSEYEDSVDAEETEDTFNDTETLIAEIASLIEEGRYYTAAERLDEVEAQLSTTETALTGMISTYKRNQLISTLAKIVAILLFIGGVAAFYVLRPREEGFYSGDGFVFHQDGRHPIHRKAEETWQQARETVRDQVKNVLEREPESEEEESPHRVAGWSGYS